MFIKGNTLAEAAELSMSRIEFKRWRQINGGSCPLPPEAVCFWGDFSDDNLTLHRYCLEKLARFHRLPARSNASESRYQCQPAKPAQATIVLLCLWITV